MPFARSARIFFAFALITSASLLCAQRAQPNRSHSFAPGTCGPVDPTYIRSAEETGGMPFFFQRTEVAQSTKFMMASTANNHVTVFWAKGTLQNSFRDFVVPIDSTLSNAMVALSVDNHDTRLEVSGPNGLLLSSDPNTDITEFTCGRIIILRKPSAGEYRMRISGSGHFWLSVSGTSDIFLFGVRFVELGGRLGHEGMFPIHGQPTVDKRATLEASISGQGTRLSFRFITPEAQPLGLLTPKLVSQDKDSQELTARLALPQQPFRVAVTGVDSNGYRFQRVHEGLVRPARVGIALTDATDVLPGHTATFKFQITNLGDQDTFRVLAVCANGWLARADRSEMALARGESSTVIVTVNVPAAAAAYTSADLVFTATSETDSDIGNGFVESLSVEADNP